MLLGKIMHKLVGSLPSSFIIHVATLFGLGYKSKAPGTLGSIAGLIFYALFFYHLNAAEYFVMSGLFIFFAITFCGETEVRLRKHDPSEIILDEFVAMPLCFIGAHRLYEVYPVWAVLLVGLLLFRFFDVIKPLGIKKLQQFHGGVGVVIDDLAAALATSFSLHLIAVAIPYFLKK